MKATELIKIARHCTQPGKFNCADCELSPGHCKQQLLKEFADKLELALENLKTGHSCTTCKNLKLPMYKEPCKTCDMRGTHWQWRGDT